MSLRRKEQPAISIFTFINKMDRDANDTFELLDEIEKDIIERDYRDMHRENSPLKQADDAVLLDSSDMTLKEVVDTITAMIDKKQGA